MFCYFAIEVLFRVKPIYRNFFYKKSPAKAKGNARQRCMCEGPVRTKSKLTPMFRLDSTAYDA